MLDFPEDEMKKSILLRQLFRSTFITMTLVELSNTVSCVVDGLVTGRLLGGEQMAAYGLAAPYFSIASIVSGILMVGGQNLCAKCLGSGDKEGANKAFSTFCIAGTVLSVVLAVFGILFSDRIAMLFGARGEYAHLLPYTSSYLKGLFAGTPFFVMLAVLAPIVQLDGGSKKANLASAMVAVVDIAADLIGVFVFKGGLLVVAIATSLSYAVALAVLLTHFAKKSAGFRFNVRDYDSAVAGTVLKVGMPRGASMLCRAIGPIVINMIVLRVGRTVGMTAMSVQSNVKFFLGAPSCGIAGAVLLLSSLYEGEKDKVLLRETMMVSLKYTGVIIMGMAAGAFCLARVIADLYLPDDAYAAEIATAAIRWYTVSLPLMTINISLAGFLQAIGRTGGSYLMNIGSELVFVVSSVIVLSGLFGLTGVWAAFAVGQLLLLVAYLISALLRKEKVSGRMDRFLFLRDDFGVSDDNRFSVSVKSMEDVAALSVNVEKFCTDRGIEKKRSFLTALFVEELAGNVIEHGFNDGRKHQLETVVTVDNGEVIIHLGDDCRKFDLKEKAENWKLDPEHPEENVGIRMVLGMAKDVSYAGAMNTNNVIVKI